MSKVRIHELAKELNVEAKIIMAKLKSKGVKVASHQSTLTEEQVSEMRQAFATNGNGGAQPAPAAAAPASGGKPKVVIRRRVASEAEPVAPSGGETAAESQVAQPEKAQEQPEPAVEAAPEPQPEPTPVKEPEPPVVKIAAEASRESEPVAPKPQAPSPVPAEKPRVAATATPAAPAPAAREPMRKREVGGATIVRRATPEEIAANIESKNRQSTGRKEDHRGTRVTGIGLLSNRVTSTTDRAGGPAAPPAAPGEEDWGNRRAGSPGGYAKDRKSEEEELARKKAAAKARRSNSNVNMRTLLSQADDLMTPEEDVAIQAAEVAPGPDPSGASAGRVYTPSASRNRRDLKRRKDLKKTQVTTPRAAYRVVEMEDVITVAELASQMAIKGTDIIKKLMAQGVMATINQALDIDTATLIATEFGFEVKNVTVTAEDILAEAAPSVEAGEATARPPIVTVMGHVDHGKTSILDAIRQANVAAGEAGGITQHIGAYSVERDGQKITFLDTPGHEAFSSMRARGAKVTDIVVLVVAADDGVMPQTKEAISHAKAANVPIIVAVNKIDKPNLNFDRIYTELTEFGIQAEEWGGETQFIKVSALKRTGIDKLLEAILLQAEVLDLKAPVAGYAEGAVIEAHLDKGRGPVATVVVQKGTLRIGDFIVAGTEVGRVRAMTDHLGHERKDAGPSTPVEIIGLSGVPMAGDSLNSVSDDRKAREVSEMRLAKARQSAGAKSAASTLEDLLSRVSSSEVPEVPIIIKGDTQGSVQAISESILKLSTPKVKNRIVHSAVGGISESDLTLAQTSGALIVGFNVRAQRGLDDQAAKLGVVLKYFSIIYEIVDAVKSIMVGKLPPIVSEVILGHAEVRKPINVPKIGLICGSAVIDGKITRSAHCRLIRNEIVIYTGKLGSLRRFKDDVKEVAQGYECGIGIDGYNDVKEGDVIEAFVLEETAATL